MSHNIPAMLLAHLRGETLSTAILWRIRKRNGVEIRGTDHDKSITIPGSGNDGYGTYLAASSITGSALRASSDFSVDNMNVEGAMPSSARPVETRGLDVNRDEVEAGLFRDAPVWIYLCNWKRPEDGLYTVQRGFLGEITRDTDGNYTTEIRGLTEILKQNILRTYSERCQVRELGDAECTVDLAALQQTGVLTAVTSRRRFDATLTGGKPAGYFSLGNLTFTTGANAGYTREIKRDDEGDVAGHLSIWDTFPNAVAIGDQFTIRPGCDRAASTCKDKYNNILNFRGYGIFIQGLDALMKGPT